MRIEVIDRHIAKGWYWGPWNSNLDIAVGFANMGVDEPHLHTTITEIYLVARGTGEMRIETNTVHLSEGQVITVEPGEAHTFLYCSPEYFHFVIQAPGLEGAEARADKIIVARSRLGL